MNNSSEKKTFTAPLGPRSFTAAEMGIEADLSAYGFWRGTEIFDADVVSVLRSGYDQLAAGMRPAQIGQSASKHENPLVRSDQMAWVDEHDDSFRPLKSAVDQISLLLRSQCYLPIRRCEIQVAHYGPGQFYARHTDRHRSRSGRLVTMVYYLSEWQPAMGGELVLYPENGDSVRICPAKNSMVLFMSDIEHEVLVSKGDRRSIVGWFRDDPS